MKFVLASASPRRKEIFTKIIGDNFTIITANGEEKADPKIPELYVKKIAYRKAEEVFGTLSHGEDVVVLSADTVVVHNGKILGKPKTEDEAKQMLSDLSGDCHSVLTGVCVLEYIHGVQRYELYVDETKVYFKPFTKEFIDGYVATGSPMDKAGAYGIQDGIPVEKTEGSYTNVVGLPEELVKKIMEKYL